ncbi:type II secretion system protein [Moritella sp. 24]|uniref:type II secretion system protein n=1 Tax=Moritella sp. 24 TaxID=2746230 RepID=UPI00272B880D|nr:hypothetical protein [Moritella sp. 24]
MVIVIIVLGILAAVAIPKFINLRDDAATVTGSEILASVHDSINLYRSGCIVRGGDIEEPLGDGKEKFEIDGIRSGYSGSCYPALKSSRKVSNANQCFEMFNSLLDAGQLPYMKYSWTETTGSSNQSDINSTFFSKSQTENYKVFIHQAGTYHSYCHFYYLDGVDLTETPYLFIDGENGKMAQGVTDVTGGVKWADSLLRYN